MMGRAFRAPKLEDLEGWKAAELLFLAGYRFWSSSGKLPITRREALDFIANNLKKPDGERLSQRIRATY